MKRRLIGDAATSTDFGDLKVFSGSAHPQLAKEICDFLGIPGGMARLRRFPDSEVSFQIDENIRGADVYIVQPTCNPVDMHLMELLEEGLPAADLSDAVADAAVVFLIAMKRHGIADPKRIPACAVMWNLHAERAHVHIAS